MPSLKKCPDLETLISKLQNQMPKPRITELAKQFTLDEKPFERTRECYKKGYLTKNEAIDLVVWKTSGMKGAKEKFSRNEATTVERFTRSAIRAETPEDAVRLLCMLNQVGVATASAFLTAWNPQEYGIIDIRCWRTLKKLTNNGYFERGKRTVFKPEEFACYTEMLKTWGSRIGLPPRTLDKALWQYDKESEHK